MLIVPMFFTLSGFLVAGSLERNKAISTFVGLRLIRIFPALCVEVFLSALILGPLLTKDNFLEYFASPIYRAYFLNMMGDIHYHLPGLFDGNPVPSTVNGQLWTVPGELKCYLVATGLAITTLIRRRLFLVGVIVLGGVVVWIRHASPGAMMANEVAQVSGGTLVLCFLAGWVMHSYRDVLPWNGWIFVACFSISFLAFKYGASAYIIPVPLAYATIFLGLTNPVRLIVIRGADYSYGMYLYGYVIQQSIAAVGVATHHWYLNLALTIPAAALFAAVSWRFVEKPALKLRKYLPPLAAALDAERRTASVLRSATDVARRLIPVGLSSSREDSSSRGDR